MSKKLNWFIANNKLQKTKILLTFYQTLKCGIVNHTF